MFLPSNLCFSPEWYLHIYLDNLVLDIRNSKFLDLAVVSKLRPPARGYALLAEFVNFLWRAGVKCASFSQGMRFADM